MKKMLILGASGLIGRALIAECQNKFDIYGTYHSTQTTLPDEKQFQVHITQIEQLKQLIQTIKPDVIISCLRGDLDQQLFFHKELAVQIKNSESIVYFFSTANVFDGDFSKHHTEMDKPTATSEYGQYKIKCENVLSNELGERAVTIRIPQIWGKESPRLRSLQQSIHTKQAIEVYRNLECNNLLDSQLAKQLDYIIQNELTGIFHLGARDMMSHEAFYKKVVSRMSHSNVHFSESNFENNLQTYYFGLQSIRTDIPESLHQTNLEIISHITS